MVQAGRCGNGYDADSEVRRKDEGERGEGGNNAQRPCTNKKEMNKQHTRGTPMATKEREGGEDENEENREERSGGGSQKDINEESGWMD